MRPFRTLYGQTSYNEVSRFIDEVPRRSSGTSGRSGQRRAWAFGFPFDDRRPWGARPVGARRVEPERGDLGPATRDRGRRRGRCRGRRSGKGPTAIPLRRATEVRHAKFGVGTVVSVQPSGSDDDLTVAFPGRGVKKLMASMAPLERAVRL